MRYNTGTPQSVLWINPASESVTGDRADATDTTSALSITSFALRQSGPNPGMGVLTFDNLKVGTTFNEVVAGSDPRLNPPTLTRIPDQTIPANTSTPSAFSASGRRWRTALGHGRTNLSCLPSVV